MRRIRVDPRLKILYRPSEIFPVLPHSESKAAAMRLSKSCRTNSWLFAVIGASWLVSPHAEAQLKKSEPTPDPYFKPVPKKPDFSDTYEPPSFSPGSIGKRARPIGATANAKQSVAWNHQRSIVRDQSTGNEFKSNIKLASAEEPATQQGTPRVASLPDESKNKRDEPAKHFEQGRVVALVGGEPLFVGDMLFEANQIIESKIPTAPESAKQVQRKKLLKALTKKFVDQKLLYVDALGKLPAGNNIDDLVKQASGVFNDQVLPKMMESSGIKNIAEFDGNLRVQGSSLRQVRTAWAKDQLARQFVQQEMNVDETVTHQEMLDEYLANKEKYAIRAKSKWEQLMVRFDKHPTKKAARKKIVELGNRVLHGANLSAVAKKDSDGFFASKGGQHDWTGKGALVLKEIDKAIFDLPVGELSDIIESRDGFHIVRVVDRNEASYTPFTEAQVEIKKQIKTDKLNAAFEQHLDSVRKRIPVEYYPLD